MHIAFVTAGGAGMFCGSCMQDNSLAKALIAQGAEVSLIPTYTPIRVDQENVSGEKVYLGGVNLYLDHAIPLWNRLPRWLVSWVDHPKVLKFATSLGIENDASKLGPLTMAMLQGGHGAMKRDYQDFVEHLVALKPDVIIFSNALLSGVLPLLRKQFSGAIFCLLQGDDLFLNQLKPKYRDKAIRAVSENAKLFDRLITHSQFYSEMMTSYLSLKKQNFSQIPLSVDVPELPETVSSSRQNENKLPRIGYFARIAPEKGVMNLVRALKILHKQGVEFELHVGGYLGKANQKYFEQIESEAQFLGERFQYVGSPSGQTEKLNFLNGLDIFSVPTDYLEPKGLYLLEALSQGVPVVQPAHGSFPELVKSTSGGLLFEPGSSEDHASQLLRLIQDDKQRKEFGTQGQHSVLTQNSSAQAAAALLKICHQGAVVDFCE